MYWRPLSQYAPFLMQLLCLFLVWVVVVTLCL